MWKTIKWYLLLLTTIAVAIASSWYVVPVAWDKMNEANTSFMANLYGLGLLLSIAPNCLAVFFLILEYETWYKKFHHYDITKRKWVRNSNKGKSNE
ncbi:MAG: hypothetical protein HRU18_01320 [Pseudoalteromonas sp.]|uniref:hypothetical protein n=1 Tax=Pseudoalteromonas sp. TaxID=53249 RepID=UPI001D8A3976|nr:hypothetical protein [Pseudoalteromonas sp.]NRA76820.1 hypothetical protein [Pseudoalteromonas sp.]